LRTQSPAAIQFATERAVRSKSARAAAMIDRELVQRFTGGDEAAFVEIVERHRGKIHTQVLRFLHNHADAEEITQDTFIRAHRGLAKFRGDSSLATWLHRIAFNLARNRYWYFFRRARHRTFSLDSPLTPDENGTFSDLVASDDADPARQASVEEFVVIVSSCMQQLEPDQREILTLRNLLHRSYDEIASTLGINLGTVKSRIARARGSLRGLLAGSCPEFSAATNASDWFEPVRGAGRME
jgi:RNA polymerase sigma-70 factor (ECF subfamily)